MPILPSLEHSVSSSHGKTHPSNIKPILKTKRFATERVSATKTIDSFCSHPEFQLTVTWNSGFVLPFLLNFDQYNQTHSINSGHVTETLCLFKVSQG